MTKSMPEYISTIEAAKILGVSRITVFNKIKQGKIKATKVGRNYVIDKNILLENIDKPLTQTNKREVEKAVRKTMKEYKQTLILLGKE